MGQTSSHGSGPVALFAVASLLLTFFVALNAMSARDPARMREVVGSFAARSQTGPGPVAIVPIAGDIPAVKAVERRWLDLFPGAGLSSGGTFGTGHVLRAELGVAGTFLPGRAETLAGASRVLAALGRIVAEVPDGLELALDVTIDTGDDAGLAIHRARHVARLLDTAGQGEVAVGVRHGTAGAVALELRLAGRTPLRPLAARPTGTGVP